MPGGIWGFVRSSEMAIKNDWHREMGMINKIGKKSSHDVHWIKG